MKFRYYVSADKDLKQPYQFCEIGLFWTFIAFIISLNLGDLIPFLKFSKFMKGELTGLTFFVFVGCLFAYLVTNLFREKVPIIVVGRMSFKAKRLAWQIKKSFSIKNVIDVLGFDNKTKYGFAMPEIAVYVDQKCDSGWVAIENMATDKILNDYKTMQRLSGILKNGHVQRLSFVSCKLSEDGNFFIYYFEDTKTSQRFVIKDSKIGLLKSVNANEIQLAKNLVWKVDGSTPHLSVIGRTRSGKSFFVGKYLCPLMLEQGWQVEFNSTKNDIYVSQYHGYFKPSDIVSRAEYWLEVMNRRNKLIKQLGKEKYSQIKDMSNVAVIFDELGNLNGWLASDKKLRDRWTTAINRLTATGASAGIHVIAISQMGTKEAFLPSVARSNCSNAVIMLGLAAASGDERKYMMPGFEIPERSYGTGQGLARIVSASSMWQQPHFFETPLIKK